MEGTTLNGRGVRRGHWAASASPEGVTISMGCELNHEWWARLSLTRDDLVALLAWVDDCRAKATAEDAEVYGGRKAEDDEPIPF